MPKSKHGNTICYTGEKKAHRVDDTHSHKQIHMRCEYTSELETEEEKKDKLFKYMCQLG